MGCQCTKKNELSNVNLQEPLIDKEGSTKQEENLIEEVFFK